MQLSAEDSAKISTLHEDYRALQDAMWSAESSKEQLCVSFKEDLDGQIANVRKQVLDIRVQAQHDMLLDPATDMHEASVRAVHVTCADILLWWGTEARGLHCQSVIRKSNTHGQESDSQTLSQVPE